MRSLRRMAERDGKTDAAMLSEIMSAQALPGLMEPQDMIDLYLFLAVRRGPEHFGTDLRDRPRRGPGVSQPLEGLIALVTGAHQGIGAACAFALGKAGAEVVCVDLQNCEETAAFLMKSGRRPMIVTTDIGDETSVCELFERIRAQARRLDILVHCAGVHRRASAARDHDRSSSIASSALICVERS